MDGVFSIPTSGVTLSGDGGGRLSTLSVSSANRGLTMSDLVDKLFNRLPATIVIQDGATTHIVPLLSVDITVDYREDHDA